MIEEFAGGAFAHDLVEVVEEEQELGQLVEGFIIAAERGTVPVLCEESVAEAVDGGGSKFREVLLVGGLLSRGGNAVAELESGFLGEGADD